jgi:HK97 gp10 family phage protein
MAEIEFKITGGPEIDRALRELPLKASRQIIRQEAKEAVQPWVDEMRSTVRRGPHVFRSGHGLRKRDKGSQVEKVFGFIAANISIRTRVNSDLEALVKVGPPRRGFWAGMLEFGTRKMHAFPFMRPAFEVGKSAVLTRFTQGVRRALEAAGLRIN